MTNRNPSMRRGLTQTLYKYLPKKWIDFYIGEIRRGFTARVDRWNSKTIEDKINQNRLLVKIDNIITNYPGRTMGFGGEINEDHYKILTPNIEKTSINAKIEPLTFFCMDCNNAITYKERHFTWRGQNSLRCEKNNCNGSLKQIRFVYTCDCGWGGPVEVKPCKKHGYAEIKYYGDSRSYSFKCTKNNCGKEIDMIKFCPECEEKKLYPTQALDWSSYIPATLSLVDLIDLKKEEFLSKDQYAEDVIISYWLCKISEEELTDFINGEISYLTKEERERKIEEKAKKFIQKGFDKEQAMIMAETIMEDNYEFNITEIINFINGNVYNNNEDYIYKLSNSILEYRAIKNNPNKTTLQEASLKAKDSNEIVDKDEYFQIAEELGIEKAQVCGKVPLVFCTYGYTRNEVSGENIVLRAFPQENDNYKNVYASKLETEGILFTFSREKILKWLVKNEFASKSEIPDDLKDEIKLKKWFINNINIDAISPFEEIDESIYPLTKYVYNLIHTISHALIINSIEFSGLDKNSLSEYIFPEIPAIFIYCQSTQGLNLGALFNIFEMHFNNWLEFSKNHLVNCIFDPVCLENQKACAGCLHINEISCAHFNKDLNRRYLIGWYDYEEKNKLHGFWED